MDDFDPPQFGHNQPPSAIANVVEASTALSAWLKGHPAIVDEATARDAKLQLDRSDGNLKAAYDDREKVAKPLYQKWQDARAPYTQPIEGLAKLIAELKARMTSYAKAEKARREEMYAAAQRLADEAARVAQEAADKEREARDNASVGDFDADVAATIAEADAKAAEAKRLARGAAVAERDADRVRLGGGFQRAAGLRTVKTIVIDDPAKVVAAVWEGSEKLRDAMVTAARGYQKLHKRLPAGCHEDEDEKI